MVTKKPQGYLQKLKIINNKDNSGHFMLQINQIIPVLHLFLLWTIFLNSGKLLVA